MFDPLASDLHWYSPLEQKQNVLRRACNELTSDPACFCVMNAVFEHDSDWGTAVGVGKDYNNWGNHKCRSTPDNNAECRTRPNGLRWAYYPTAKDGIYGNVSLYAKRYANKGADYVIDVWVQTATPDYKEALRACF